MIQFAKAVKYDSKGRIAIVGPAGAGKSYTMLKALRAMVGPQGKIACVDTEHGSLSKYADVFEFDVIELDSFSPQNFLDALEAASANGYDGFGCDSLSHFWMGRGGALEFVDQAKRRSSSRDDMSGWKDFSPIERQMIDAMISSKCHVAITMRTKTEYQEEEYTNARGERKKKRVKIGLAPVQRQGLEYEFDLIGYMNEENDFVVEKTRCPFYSQRVMSKPGEKEFSPFVDWLRGAKRESLPNTVVPGTAFAARAVANAKLQNGGVIPEGMMPQDEPQDEPSADPEMRLHIDILAHTKAKGNFDKFKMLPEFQKLKKRFQSVGDEAAYYRVLARCGVEKSNQLVDEKMARVAYKEMGNIVDNLESAKLSAQLNASLDDIAPEVERLPDAVPLVLGEKRRCQGALWIVVDSDNGHQWQLVPATPAKGGAEE